MPNDKPKRKNSEKIKFFKIGGDGEIEPAFPDDRTQTSVDTNATSENDNLAQADTKLTGSGLENIGNSSPYLEEQMHLLKPQVEDISKIPQQNELTQDQVEVLRKYIALKETEVRDFSDQKRQYQSFIKKVSSEIESYSHLNRELVAQLEKLRKQNESISNENRSLKDKYKNEVRLIKSEYEDKMRISGDIESQVDHLGREQEDWKNKVRDDLKKIKLKERELENKYELLKRDSQALLDSKDQHVLELKKKSDALELELESMEERLRSSNAILSAVDSKKQRLIETFKLAISLLEAIDQMDLSENEEDIGEKAS